MAPPPAPGGGRAPTNPSWLRTSLWGTFWMIPPLLSIPFFSRNFGMSFDVIGFWYFVGICVMTTGLFWRHRRLAELLPSPRSLILQMLGTGLVFVGAAYGLQMWSIGIAPNPGLPTGVYSALGPVVFFSSIAVGKMPHARLRRHFGDVTRHATQAIGVLFVIPGSLLIAAGTDLRFGNWLGLTLAAIPLMAVGQLGMRWFKAEHGIAQEVVMLWYFLGTLLALLALILAGGRGAQLLAAPSWGVPGMLLVGLTAGTTANWLMFRAVVDAPNPGLAYSVYSGSAIGAYFGALAGAWLAPAYFPAAGGDAGKLAGIVLVMVGVLLIGGMWEYFTGVCRPGLPQPTQPPHLL